MTVVEVNSSPFGSQFIACLCLMSRVQHVASFSFGTLDYMTVRKIDVEEVGVPDGYS